MNISDFFNGRLLVTEAAFKEKLDGIKAFVFDWDGVFNAGFKDSENASPFSEVDSMGTNLLRFNHYLLHKDAPLVAIISGEKNKAALAFAQREHVASVYCGIKYKAQALQHLREAYSIQPQEVCFFFDDVIDFSIAQVCGLRIMTGRSCNPLLTDFAVRNGLADYITANDGGHGGIREAVELLCGISGKYDEAIQNRSDFSEVYQRYLAERDKPEPKIFVVKDKAIAEVEAL